MMASVTRSTNVLPMKHAHNIDPLERLEATRLGSKRWVPERNTTFDKQRVSLAKFVGKEMITTFYGLRLRLPMEFAYPTVECTTADSAHK